MGCELVSLDMKEKKIETVSSLLESTRTLLSHQLVTQRLIRLHSNSTDRKSDSYGLSRFNLI